MKPKPKTYELVVGKALHRPRGFLGIRCLKCGMTSYHPKDIEYRYCAKCGEYHDG